MARTEAIIAAGRVRLRPIMMTSLAMIFGMLPMAIGGSEGAETRAPMAFAIIGGMVSSTVLTLIVLPVVTAIWIACAMAAPAPGVVKASG
jgi:HAE1 family hydrophobic/amphiphilic exporter-1